MDAVQENHQGGKQLKITRTIDGKEYEFELTAKELSDAWYEETERDLRKEADWAFDHYLTETGKSDFSSDDPRVTGESGIIPGSKAYRDAWREVFVDSHQMWEDHGWERFMKEHPLTQIRRMSLEDMKPVVDETEKWLDRHPGADREHVRRAVMKEFLDHIWGTEPMREIKFICLDACLTKED